MVSFKLEQGDRLSNEEIKMLNEAKKRPIVYDADSPRLTDDMEKAFIAARKEKPYKINDYIAI